MFKGPEIPREPGAAWRPSIMPRREQLDRVDRRVALGALLGLGAIGGCIHAPTFTIEWEEEVELIDGGVIVVRRIHHFERKNRLQRYESGVMRDTELHFDAGPPFGLVHQYFKRYRATMLERVESVWYMAVMGTVGSVFPIEERQRWGSEQNGAGDKFVILTPDGFRPIPLAQVPREIRLKNLWPLGSMAEIVSMDGKRLDLVAKRNFKYETHPNHYGTHIHRPKVPIPFRPDE